MTTTKKRAPGMSPEQRREMIVAAALPLVAEYGTGVTTGQIARAAGIGEATIFRVFADKDEVLDACLAEAMSPDHVLRELASIEEDQPLAARLTDAVDAMAGHLNRVGAVAGSLVSSGHLRGTRPQPAPDARENFTAAIRASVAELIEPDRESLRYPVEQAADVFVSLMLTRTRSPETGPSTADMVDMLLHGCAHPRERLTSPA